jgi:hypothetical protein
MPVWQRVEGFPPQGTSLSAIAAVDTDDFVVAGSSASPSPECPSQREARLWTSSDGLAWTELRLEEAGNTTADVAPVDGQGWPLIGTTGSPGCPGSGPVGWNPSDTSDWQRSAISGLEPGDEILDMVAVGNSQAAVASGNFAGDDDAMGVWTVQLDALGSRWQHAAIPPTSPADRASLGSLAANGQVVVGFDVTRNPHAWFSLDAGQTWASSDFRTLYGLQTTDSDAGHGGFVAVARGCCGLPDQRFGVIVRSSDGEGWTEARTGLFFAKPIEAVVATEGGWIALGQETYLSGDGSDWRLGPPLPTDLSQAHLVNGVPVPFRLAAATVGRYLIAITPTEIWRASAEDLAADRWFTAAPEAEMPHVGDQYAFTLLTHCGPTNRTLNFGKRSWLPDLPEGYFPLSFDGFYEHGTLNFVAADRIEFTGRKGDVVVYLPTGEPPHSFPCH